MCAPHAITHLHTHALILTNSFLIASLLLNEYYTIPSAALLLKAEPYLLLFFHSVYPRLCLCFLTYSLAKLTSVALFFFFFFALESGSNVGRKADLVG